MKELIRKLVEGWGPSGFEHHIRAVIREEVQALADEIRVDALGNLICRMGEGGTKVMIAAHMDEIGVMVSHVDKDGFLRFANIGGVFQATLHGNRVKFENGTIGTVAVEDAWGAHRYKLPTNLDAFYIDVDNGTDEHGINVGDVATFWRPMDENGSRVIGKSMDDRIGCAVAIATMQKLKAQGTPHEVYFVFTVQEEVGVRGATPATTGIAPDFGIALDLTPTRDIPKGARSSVTMGQGAAIKVMDVRYITPPQVKDLMVRTAEQHNIPHQLEVMLHGSTDARGIQAALSGIPSGVISIPGRHLHTTSEIVDVNDVQAAVDLLTAVLTNPIEGIRPE